MEPDLMTTKTEDNSHISFSFIVVTRNNKVELTTTINSICAEAPQDSEIVVVDGSDSPLGASSVASVISNDEIALGYVLDEGKGVYQAQNLGISKSIGRWIIVINSGDNLEKGACSLLESVKNSKSDLVVFSQSVIDTSGNLSYQFFPTEKTVWPHQSVVVKREVYETYGLYPEKYRYASEQWYFASIRKTVTYEIRNEVLSAFRLGGITSGAALAHSRESYIIRRLLGCGVIYSFINAYVFAYVRYTLERVTSLRGVVCVLRKMVYPSYRTPK